MRIIFACTLAGILGVPAKADETLKWRQVQYVASVQSQQVGDVTGHVQGFIRYPGIASFPDGSTARTFVFNAFDGIAGPGGGGTVNGYENIIFSDGSELWLKYTGTYKLSSTANGMPASYHFATISAKCGEKKRCRLGVDRVTTP